MSGNRFLEPPEQTHCVMPQSGQEGTKVVRTLCKTRNGEIIHNCVQTQMSLPWTDWTVPWILFPDVSKDPGQRILYKVFTAKGNLEPQPVWLNYAFFFLTQDPNDKFKIWYFKSYQLLKLISQLINRKSSLSLTTCSNFLLSCDSDISSNKISSTWVPSWFKWSFLPAVLEPSTLNPELIQGERQKSCFVYQKNMN